MTLAGASLGDELSALTLHPERSIVAPVESIRLSSAIEPQAPPFHSVTSSNFT